MGRCAISVCNQSPGSTQPSIPRGWVNRVPDCLAGVRAWCVHLCQVAGNTVILYGRWHPVAVTWSYINSYTRQLNINYIYICRCCCFVLFCFLFCCCCCCYIILRLSLVINYFMADIRHPISSIESGVLYPPIMSLHCDH